MPRRTPVVESKPIITDAPDVEVTPAESPKAIAHATKACHVCGTEHAAVCPTCGHRHEVP